MRWSGSLVAPPRAARARRHGRWPAAFAPRFFLALLVGLVWLGPAWWEPRFAYVMLAWDGLALLAWLADWRRLPEPHELEISRIWLAPLSLEVESKVAVELRNHARVAFRAVLLDDIPPALVREPPRLPAEVAGRGAAGLAYTVRPVERGDVKIGGVYASYQSPWRLAERWAVAELGQTVRVYPNLEEAKRHTLYLIRSRQIELEKRLKRQPGIGRQFESLREYRQGDEPRDICWTATARRARLISKVYQPERSQAVEIVVDAGRLMLARVGGPGESLTKLDRAVNAALALAQVALRSGDRVGLLSYGRKLQARLGATAGRESLRGVVEALAVVRGELLEADHAAAADQLLALGRQRSLVVWLTDLAETAATPEVIEAASRLLRRHLVMLVAIAQPQLDALVGKRPRDLETMYRYVAALEMIHRREVLLGRLRQQGALVLDLEPGQVSTGLVNRYLLVKERGLL